ncbi:MAG: DNA recombination protein RmuC [Deltaproteobacteria bacterium]|nr:DNA recombination protein RmuC [Deltaproteobacteria bacterium]
METFLIFSALLLGLVLGVSLFYFWLHKPLSAQALLQNNESFVSLAETKFLSPLRDSLNQMNFQIRELEKNREGAYRALHQQVGLLKTETQTLSRALHSPIARGRWGEIQLKRIVELAGMIAHCDFEEQLVKTTDSTTIRPDLVVNLPGNKCIVVDSKAPLNAYLKAIELDHPKEQQVFIAEHAEQLRKHILQLSKKSYWKHFEPSPEFVVLFLPGEVFLSTALSAQPHLIEFAAEQNVILATPMTLIAMLRAIAYGWRQEAASENAAQITQKARELCDRLGILVEHFDKLGKSLKNSVDSYNQAMASFESRVLVTARQMTDLGEFETGSAIKTLETVEKTPKC